MPISNGRIDLRLSSSSIKNPIERIPVLSVINHGAVMLEGKRILSWPKSTKNSYILPAIRFAIALVRLIFFKGRLYQ